LPVYDGPFVRAHDGTDLIDPHPTAADTLA
jgi:hypothetical protein